MDWHVVAGVFVVVILAMEALPLWREANRRINADIAFLRSIPKGVERDEK